MRQIEAYPYDVMRYALKFSALTFCRPGEIRHALWFEGRKLRLTKSG
ncbi:hypothetical protein FACS1894167_00490 [Synergistales bacterium]|nr:hypothetical protein FACS1894167_00490 [Synergistales bacterium]